jgi:hypothetical protein
MLSKAAQKFAAKEDNVIDRAGKLVMTQDRVGS